MSIGMPSRPKRCMKHLKEKYRALDEGLRLYGMSRPIVALTGGVASGKSTVTGLLRERGIRVICADELVRDLYKTPRAKEFVSEHFPGSVEDGHINFHHLRGQVFSSPQKREKLEDFIHPLLRGVFCREVASMGGGQDFIVYDIPLLFEKGLEDKVDCVVCVWAPRREQMRRLMARDGIGEDLAARMVEAQGPLEEKREASHFVLSNESTLNGLRERVEEILHNLLQEDSR